MGDCVAANKNTKDDLNIAAGKEGHFLIVDSMEIKHGFTYYMTRDPAVGPRGVRADILVPAMLNKGNAIIIEK